MNEKFTAGPWDRLNGFIIDSQGVEILEVKTVCANKVTPDNIVNVANKAQHKRTPEEVEANILLAKNAPKMLRLLNALADKFKFQDQVRLGVQKEINEALDIIVEVTVPPPPAKTS